MRESKEETPTVSVIIPTYNRANMVSRAIQSVLEQTYEDFELIVVDDASTDNTEDVVKGFNDSKIKYLRHDENKGGSVARNTGIRHSVGKFLSFLDDDDEFLPDHLTILVETIKGLGSEWGIVYGGKIAVDGNNSSKIYPKWKGEVSDKILVYGSVGIPTALIRRSCFEIVGLFDESFPRHQDWEMYVRLAKRYKFFPVNDATVRVYSSSPPSLKNVLYSKQLFLEKFSEEISSLTFLDRRKFFFKHYNTLAKFSFKENSFYIGSKWFFKGIINYPFRLKSIGSTLKELF